MPELPEVETIRRGVAEWVSELTIAEVDIRHPRSVRDNPGGAAEFITRLRGQKILGARRRGKFMWLPLGSGDAVTCHLGMSGQLLISDTHAAIEPHLRIRFTFEGHGQQLRFVDQRIFGWMRVSPGGAAVPPEIDHIAADVYDPDFNPEQVVDRIGRRRTQIKRALLDQSLISGIGNIYADEALWAARVHGRQATRGLSPHLLHRVLNEVRAVFDAALLAGGTSFDSLYVNVNGQSGYFARGLAVYGRDGQECRRCQTVIVREAFAGRSSYWCPGCQPEPSG